MSKIYKAQYAGGWYPKDKNELEAIIKNFLENADLKDAPEKLKGLIAPHAGYIYSGQTAAYGFKALKNIDFDLAVILAPSHRAYINTISICNFSKIRTPLGELELDTDLNSKLLENEKYFQDSPQVYEGEHSFELEIPFLQYVSKDKNIKILPLIVGELSQNSLKDSSDILNELLANRKPVFISSSDFTHYGASFGYVPFEDNIPENIKDLDMRAIKLIEANDIQGLISYFIETHATICGKNAILFLMSLLEKHKAKLLNYTTSGELTGDYSHSVSYASIVFE